jgi:DNA-binding NarL/FixJ family response regulator
LIRVLIADDHPVVRQGLRTFLGVHEDIEVVGEAPDGAEAVARAEALQPDGVLLDLKMPGSGGQAALTAPRGVTARVIVLTSMTDRGHVLPAVRAGVAGFLYKDIDPQALVRAIRGARWTCIVRARGGPGRARRGDPGWDDRAPAALTDREREVLAQIALGRSNREIARVLVVSEKTIKSHVSNILMKLGLGDRTQAALHAVRHGIVED